MASTIQSYINSIVRTISNSVSKNKAFARNYSSSNELEKKKTYGSAINIKPLDVADVEQAWIDNLKEHVDFLNDNLRCYSLLFRVQRRELVRDGDASS
jgi:hypothetical protein